MMVMMMVKMGLRLKSQGREETLGSGGLWTIHADIDV
jgi:hypothetical protein